MADVRIEEVSLDDRTIGRATVRSLMGAMGSRVPTREALDAAVLAYDEPSPAMLEWHARWLDVIAELRAALSPIEIVQVFARAGTGAYLPGLQMTPSAEVLDVLLARDATLMEPWLEAMRSAAIAGTIPSSLLPMAAAAAARLEGPAPLRLVDFYARPGPMRALVERATVAERAAWVETFLGVAEMVKRAGRQGAAEFVANRIERLLPVIDLCDDPASRAHVDEALAIAQRSVLDEAVAHVRAHGRGTTPMRPTAAAEKSRAYLEDRYAVHRKGEALPAIAAATAERAVQIAGAGELADRAAWARAGSKRRRAIVAAVDEALGADFAIEEVEGVRAVLWHAPSNVRFVIVPGGAFTMGFSQKEEAIVRRAAERARDAGTQNFYEEYGHCWTGSRTCGPCDACR
jgi:hypothetical protein